MRIPSVLRAAALLLALASCVDAPAPTPGHEATTTTAADPATFHGTVTRVVDGDTFVLSGERRRIRVWGLDAPEWNHQGGAAATQAMRQLVEGRNLACRLRDVDRYGRYVGQCFLPDGRDITAEMIRMGVAREYCTFSRGFYGTC